MRSPLPASCRACDAPLSAELLVCPRCGMSVLEDSASQLFAPASPSVHAAPSPWESVLERLRDVTDGEFEIGRELGRGGMAAVFLARDLALNRRVAIKVMAPGLMMGEGMIERFRQEAITIANLSHPHIVSIYAVRQRDDLHFFVMQFIAGRSLESVLRAHGRLSVPVVRAILFHVGSALAYAHRRGVVHRDIKPGNILMSGDGDALVTDFGIAKVAAGPTQTQTGMVVGTPTYMSPEQCFAQAIDGRSDQYSLGIVAYELLAGVTPFVGSTFEIMRGHTTDAPAPLTAYRPDLPPQLDAALARMLQKSPADRFPSLTEALAAMDASAVGDGDPLRREMIALAAVEERRTMLGDLLHTPSPSVLPSGGRGSGATGARTPQPSSRTGATSQTLVAIAPITASLEPGDSLTLQAKVVGDDATAIRWSVDTPACGAVDPVSGQLTALAPGQGHVLATVGSVTERTPFVVVAPSVALVRLDPVTDTLHVGDVTQVRAQALDKRERPLERPMEWSAAGRSVQIAHSGASRCTVECIAEGASVLTVTCDGVSSSAVLQITAARTEGTGTRGTAAVGAAAPPSPTEGSRRRPVGLYAIVALLVLAAGAAGAAVLLRGPNTGTAPLDDTERTASESESGERSVAALQAVPTEVASTTTSDEALDSASRGAIDSVRTAPPSTTGSVPVSAAPPATRPVTSPGGASAPTSTSAPVGVSASQREEQALLAREARAIIESFAAAVETRQISRVRAVYPGLSSGNVETFENMFRSTTAVRLRVRAVEVVNGAPYDPVIGSRTFLTADVTFELIPSDGSTIPLIEDVLPVTLQRVTSGWRLEQIGLP